MATKTKPATKKAARKPKVRYEDLPPLERELEDAIEYARDAGNRLRRIKEFEEDAARWQSLRIAISDAEELMAHLRAIEDLWPQRPKWIAAMKMLELRAKRKGQDGVLAFDPLTYENPTYCASADSAPEGMATLAIKTGHRHPPLDEERLPFEIKLIELELGREADAARKES